MLNTLRDPANPGLKQQEPNHLRAYALTPLLGREWESNIHTAGVVGKIKAKYDAFMKAEYNVESAVG